MSNKVTGFRISDKALYCLKYYCFINKTTMSKVIEKLIFEHLELPGFKNPEAEKNTSESE